MPAPTAAASVRRYRFSRALAAVTAVFALALGVAGYWAKARAAARIVIGPGDFEMGSTSGERDEAPVHRVHVARFALERREVTVADYARCVNAKRCTPAGTFHERCVAKSGGGPELPINCLSFAQAQAYCAFRGGRLPSEPEWEYAARKDEPRSYPWGNERPTSEVCWQQPQPCRAGSKSKDRSALGVLDLAGNVSEWTSSGYCSYADATRCKAGVRVTRGGSFDLSDPQFLRTTYRDWVREADAGYNLGVRCAFSVD